MANNIFLSFDPKFNKQNLKPSSGITNISGSGIYYNLVTEIGLSEKFISAIFYLHINQDIIFTRNLTVEKYPKVLCLKENMRESEGETERERGSGRERERGSE